MMRLLQVIAVIGMLGACSDHMVPVQDLAISYSQGNVDAVIDELETYDHLDQATAFPVSVNAYMKSYLNNGLASSLKEARRINEDFYSTLVTSEIAARDSVSYSALISEWESGTPSKYANICVNIRGFDTNHADAECDCREILVDESLTNIGVGTGFPNAERALWIAQSSEKVCGVKNVPWTLVSGLLKYDLYGGDKDSLNEVISGQNLQDNTLAMDWICSLKGRYSTHEETSLDVLVGDGLISCSQ